jgi:uncharacterized membrane protein YhfC
MANMFDIHYVTYPLNGLLMIALPTSLGVFLVRKFGLGWRIWWIGAGTFILSQIGHIPFNSVLTLLFQRGVLPSPSPEWRLPFNAAILGLSAGLWEELARYAILRWWARDIRSWRQGVLYGAGHGGIEAILLGVLVLYNFFYMLAIRSTELSALVPPDQLAAAQSQVTSFWSAPWYQTLLGALERAFTIPTQIALAVLVLQCLLRGQKRWLVAAIAWHTVVDCVAVFGSRTLNVYSTEVIIGGFALISLVIILILHRIQPEIEDRVEPPAPLTPMKDHPIKPLDETNENLENTRYT